MKLDKLHISSNLLMPHIMSTHDLLLETIHETGVSLVRLTRAIREGKWDLCLSSFSEMLPYFAAFDHSNYTRWGVIFLADMKMLPQTA